MKFEYDPRDERADAYECLQSLMLHWENEIAEFKEAKGNYSEDKIGCYFSAISNEAHLKGAQYGWFVMGVSESGNRHVVGTNFKFGDPELLEKFKFSIAGKMTDGMTFLDVIELFPVCNGQQLRVLMLKIPAAVAGMPTACDNKYYARSGDSLVPLPQHKIDIIRRSERNDWSRRILPQARLEHLDKKAIQFARERYKEKMNRTHIAEEIDAMDDEAFLTKLKLVADGKITNAAMLLLGNPDYDNLFERAPSLMWRLIGRTGEVRDYAIFTIPFIFAADQIFVKLRNLTYRYMPNQNSLFPTETQQYDSWMLRELFHNCIAHSNYQLGGRIYVNECEEHIVITNPGEFLPKTVSNVLQPTYNPPFYLNQLLADAMVKFHMIDTATSGIKKVFRIQRTKFFPLPDYDFSKANEISVKVYGKVLSEQYTNILFNNPELDIETVFLLDMIQKGHAKKIRKEDIDALRKSKLIEGRFPNLFLSMKASQDVRQEAQYIKNKAFDDKYYRDLIMNYIREFGKADRKALRELLLNKLSDVLSADRKERKIRTLLTSLKRQGKIKTSSDNHQKSSWILA